MKEPPPDAPYEEWRRFYDWQRKKLGRPPQPKYLRQRARAARKRDAGLPILFRLAASMARAVARGSRD